MHTPNAAYNIFVIDECLRDSLGDDDPCRLCDLEREQEFREKRIRDLMRKYEREAAGVIGGI